MKVFLITWTVLSVFNVSQAQEARPIRAIAVLVGEGIEGNVTFRQSGCGEPVTIEVSLTGLTEGAHGFHIHEKGDLSVGCVSLAAHFNPNMRNHGAPNDTVRHVGDLGNIRVEESGVAKTNFSDNLISLTGLQSVVGRGLIVHQDIDDLGKGGQTDSLTTGNAGARVACGIIGYLDEEAPPQCLPSNANMISMLCIPVFSIIGLILHSLN